MLRLPKTLLFPTLTFSKDANFKGLPSTHSTGVYFLDWKKAEEIKHNRWEEQFPASAFPTYSEHALPNSRKVSYCECIPESQKKWVDSMQFLLSEEYLQEIRHCSLKAAEEWERRKPITKHGIDPAMGPAISYVNTAFHLLSDCLFDPDTEYYSRSEDKLIAPFILLYRFWAYQTSFHNVREWSSLSELHLTLENKKDRIEPSALNFGMTVYKDLQEHLQLLEQNHYYQKTETKMPSEDDVLGNFISNKVAGITLQERQIYIPRIGNIRLIYPVKFRRAKGKITLTAEFSCPSMEKIVQKLLNYNQTFEFSINGNPALVAKEATIKSISSTPPPVITIEFLYFTAKSRPDLHELHECRQRTIEEPYVAKECRKIDMKKIEEAAKIGDPVDMIEVE